MKKVKEIKDHGKKFFYWLTLGIILIVVYKILDDITGIASAISGFFKIIGPIIAGIFVAYFLYIPCSKVEKLLKKSKYKFVKTKARTFSIAIVYIIAFIVIALISTYILPVIIESSIELLTNLQGYFEQAVNKYQNLPDDSILKSGFVADSINVVKSVDIKQYININNIMAYAKEAIGLINGIVNIFVTIIVSIYVLIERTKIYMFIKKAAKATMKEARYNTLSKYFNSANKIFLGFISSQVIDGIVVGIITTIAMIIMGIKYAPFLGFLIGLFNIIPYVGAIIAVVIAAIITLFTGGVSQAIWMIFVVVILQQIDANIINPKIIGNNLKMSPLLVLIAIIIGGAYWGMLGIFVAVPVSALIKIIAEDYIDYKTKLKQTKKETEQKREEQN